MNLDGRARDFGENCVRELWIRMMARRRNNTLSPTPIFIALFIGWP